MAHLHQLLDCQVRQGSVALRHVGHGVYALGAGHGGERCAVVKNAALGVTDSRHGTQQGGLARAIRADDADDARGGNRGLHIKAE